MDADPKEAPSAEVMEALRNALPTGSGELPMESYIQCVLYHASVGYYRKPRRRVGRSEESDFYTASSMGSLFPELVVAGVKHLLGNGWREHTWVEAGPESENGILGELDECPFHDARVVRPGDSFELPRKTIFFSNELFDAQPFRRLVRSGNRWMEAGVRLLGDRLEPVVMEPVKPLPDLPQEAPEGYTIDWPAKAHALLESIAAQDWEGLFIAFDYGIDRSIALNERPAGTGRTYARHRMGTDLLANPGSADITCHVLWDVLEAILARHGFSRIEVLRQESFFMNYAQEAIRELLTASPDGFSARKQTLMELLHPGNMGHKFQVLCAVRGDY